MRNVLIVEDNPHQALLYRQELSDEGYQVEVVDRAREAIARVAEERPVLLILDVRLPGMDGIEALQHLRAEHPALPIILHSGYSHLRGNYLAWAADAYVVKSSDLTELKDAIQSVLARQEADRTPLPAAH